MRSNHSSSISTLLPIMAVLASGCGSHGSVSLSGDIRGASVVLEERALGTFVSAELDLFIELGAFAPGPARVEGAAFSLVESETQTQIGAALEMTPDRTFPLEIAKGASASVHFATGAATDPVGAELRDDLCTGSIALRGDIRYVLDGEESLDVRSSPLTPDGC